MGRWPLEYWRETKPSQALKWRVCEPPRIANHRDPMLYCTAADSRRASQPLGYLAE